MAASSSGPAGLHGSTPRRDTNVTPVLSFGPQRWGQMPGRRGFSCWLGFGARSRTFKPRGPWMNQDLHQNVTLHLLQPRVTDLLVGASQGLICFHLAFSTFFYLKVIITSLNRPFCLDLRCWDPLGSETVIMYNAQNKNLWSEGTFFALLLPFVSL